MDIKRGLSLTEPERWIYGEVLADGHAIVEEDNGNIYLIKPETVTGYVGYNDELDRRIFQGDILNTYTKERLFSYSIAKDNFVPTAGEPTQVVGDVWTRPELIAYTAGTGRRNKYDTHTILNTANAE